MRVVSYSRVSTSHHFQNPQVQVDEIRRYCLERNWKLVDEVVDHGFSGGTDNRPGLKKLLALVSSEQVNGVVVTKMDRLFRSLKHLVTMLDDFSASGIQFVAIKDNVDYSTPGGRLFVQVLGSLAEFEKALARERTVAGLEYAKLNGKKLGRPRTSDPEKILELRANGLSYRQIARELKVSRGAVYRIVTKSRSVSESGAQNIGDNKTTVLGTP